MSKFLLLRKPKNKDRRSREYLTSTEVEDTIKAARRLGRHGNRDATMILMAYRHGFRVSELVCLRWQQVNLKAGLLQVSRLKNGIDSIHPLFGPELRGLRKIERDYPDTQYVFVSERKGPMTTSTFTKIFARAANEAGIDIFVHPHMLRHSTGFKLGNDSVDTYTIQQYLGHKNIKHTTKYTDILSAKFNNFWAD
jgi:site-specific recombinase XerD